jgi:hypothetical protein
VASGSIAKGRAEWGLLAWAGDARRGQQWRIYFAAIFCLYLVLTIFCQRDWFLPGSMYAEMAVNYYANAIAPDWVTRLFATDSGYIPLPQRLLALALAGVPVGSVPYVYQVTAFLFGGLLVAAFLHPIFCALVRDDRVRALVCLAFCCIPDFEVRGFINFTYLGLCLTVPLIALALTRDAPDAPWWAWALPLLLLSKPAELALLPAIVLALVAAHLFAKPRFRLLLLLSLLMGAAQLVRMMTSAGAVSGAFVDPHATLLTKLQTALVSGVGTLGGFTLGLPLKRTLGLQAPWLMIVVGAALTYFYLVAVARRWRAPPALLLVGGILLFTSAFLNSFVLSKTWNLQLDMLRQWPIFRWSLGCAVGAVFCAASAGQILVSSDGWRARRFGTIGLFPMALLWSAVAFWPIALLNAFPPTPVTGNSYWRSLAGRIAGGGPVCVPLDPYFGFDGKFWMYRRDCTQLNRGPSWAAPVRALQGPERVTIAEVARGKPLLGLIAFVRPRTAGPVRLAATVVADDGRTIVLSGERRVGSAGGIILLSPPGDAPVTISAPLLLDGPAGLDLLRDADGAPALVALGLDAQAQR